jgi:hypothetical protein
VTLMCNLRTTARNAANEKEPRLSTRLHFEWCGQRAETKLHTRLHARRRGCSLRSMAPSPTHVNGSTPTQLRVDAITTAMGLPSAAHELRQKIATFCRLNGHAGVLAAAQQAGLATNVEDPWAYTVAAYKQ